MRSLLTLLGLLIGSLGAIVGLQRLPTGTPLEPFTPFLVAVLVIVAIGIILGMLGILIFTIYQRRSTWLPIVSSPRVDVYRWGHHRYQELLDRAEQDRDHPNRSFRFMSCTIISTDRNPHRPFLTLDVRVFNGSVFAVLVTGKQGVGAYHGVPLAEELTLNSNGTRWPPLHEADIRLTQYIPTNLAAKVFNEVDTGILQSVSLASVTLSVRAESLGAKEVRLPLHWPNGFIYVLPQARSAS
jgi:hypothetical protein